MKHFGKGMTAVAGAMLAAALVVSPATVQAQTNGNNPPAAYGNSGSTAAGPGTGAAARYNNDVGRSGGDWGIWGLLGLLGLFGIGLGRRRTTGVTGTDLPRSGARNPEVNTITGAGPATAPPPRTPPPR